jgi:hypothetical protein
MSFRNALTLSVAAGILATLSVIPASAGTFAQFVQQTGTNAFSLSGAFPPGQVLATNATPIFFQFKNVAGNPTNTIPVSLFDQNISAIATLTATSNGPAVPGTFDSESFGNATFTFTTVANQTVNGNFIPAGSLLLKGVVTPSGIFPVAGTLSGLDQGNSATFAGSDVNNLPINQNTVMFSSDYIDFTGSMSNAYAFSFSSVFMDFRTDGGFPFTNIKPFTAAGTGTFSSTAGQVPEPGAVAMLAGLGVTGSLFAFRRLRRRR